MPAMQKDWVICSPHSYYSETHQDFIARSCLRENRQWIYELIDSGVGTPDETVLVDNAHWLLCVDKHPGADTRYLIVFRDPRLKTIRDLRQGDVAMLRDMHTQVLQAMRAHQAAWTSFSVYFHYNPSVYQLHAHVCDNTVRNAGVVSALRCHDLRHVVRNLAADSLWYRKALILTCKTKMFGRTQAPRGDAKW
jgi:diadenosine tetraphosphate (Ap4A) HIT family hydrolase